MIRSYFLHPDIKKHYEIWHGYELQRLEEKRKQFLKQILEISNFIGYNTRKGQFCQRGIVMGIYLNPGNDGFWESVRSPIYVDKTGLIARTNALISTEEKYICITRPRRFGKSMALEMLAAYYSCGCNSRKLFEGLEIEKDNSYQ